MDASHINATTSGSSTTHSEGQIDGNATNTEDDSIPIGWEYLEAETGIYLSIYLSTISYDFTSTFSMYIGEFYYYHPESRTSRRKKPSQKVIDAVNLRHAESVKQANEASEKRKAEKEINAFVENEVAEYTSQLKSVIGIQSIYLSMYLSIS
jgi:hypothetical protein